MLLSELMKKLKELKEKYGEQFVVMNIKDDECDYDINNIEKGDDNYIILS